jgi:small subunit ribosomal protein S3
MGNKTNPHVLRLGIIHDWDCNWFATREYAHTALEDFHLRKYLKDELDKAGVARIVINRRTGILEARVSVSRAGMIFGKRGIELDLITAELEKRTKQKVKITIVEEKNPEIISRLLSEWIAGQLEKRVPFRRAMKMAIQKALKAGAQGVKVRCSGRLGGTEIARTEIYREGKVPLHTLRADIDYAFSEALTTYGKIGVKVWVCKGEVFGRKKTLEKETAPALKA